MTESTQTYVDRPLERGAHNDPGQGACVMEWLRLREGEAFSDERLECQCPAIHRALISFNDRMPDEPRQRLKAIAVKSLGTAGDGRAQARLYCLADVACREWAPAALEARGRADLAGPLRALRAIKDRESALAAEAAAADAAADAADAAYAAAPAVWSRAIEVLEELVA